jgi:hypothetical protein
MIRLRQVALVADDLDVTVSALCHAFGLTVCFTDPGVAEFGLRNALMTVGDQFLEVVAPARNDTTAARLLDKRFGAGTDRVSGYMAIYEVDDLDARERFVRDQGVRIAWHGDFATIRGRHLHPGDVGGAIVSIDQPVPNGSWAWAGPDWQAHQHTEIVTAIAGIGIGAADPVGMQARWHDLGIRQSVRFMPAGPHGDGIDVLELVATQRERAGEEVPVGGIIVHLV